MSKYIKFDSPIRGMLRVGEGEYLVDLVGRSVSSVLVDNYFRWIDPENLEILNNREALHHYPELKEDEIDFNLPEGFVENYELFKPI